MSKVTVMQDEKYSVFFTKPSRKALSFSYGDIRHSQKI